MVKNKVGVPCAPLNACKKNKTDDVIRINYEIQKFKKFCNSNRLSDLESVFTVRLVATRSSKLDLILICFNGFFSDPKVTHPLHTSYPGFSR